MTLDERLDRIEALLAALVNRQQIKDFYPDQPLVASHCLIHWFEFLGFFAEAIKFLGNGFFPYRFASRHAAGQTTSVLQNQPAPPSAVVLLLEQLAEAVQHQRKADQPRRQEQPDDDVDDAGQLVVACSRLA